MKSWGVVGFHIGQVVLIDFGPKTEVIRTAESGVLVGGMERYSHTKPHPSTIKIRRETFSLLLFPFSAS